MMTPGSRVEVTCKLSFFSLVLKMGFPIMRHCFYSVGSSQMNALRTELSQNNGDMNMFHHSKIVHLSFFFSPRINGIDLIYFTNVLTWKDLYSQYF